MSTPPLNPALSVSEYIAQFKGDVNLTHMWATGGPQEEVVVPETGQTYPTLAKLIYDSQQALAVALVHQGFAIRNYRFLNADTLHVKHNMGSTSFVETITGSGGERIYANVRVVDNTEFVVEFTEPVSGTVTVTFCLNT
jgi:hypothetical protein